MVDLARRQLAGSAVRFEVASFEEFEAEPGSFDLIVSATAFHWIDPDVAWSKSARLLRPGGWLAVLGVRETYADPVGGRLVDAWIRHRGDGGAWARGRKIAVADIMASTGLFAPPRVRSHVERTAMRPEVVLDLERTRATYLDYDAATRYSFTAALREAVAGLAEVPAEIHTHIAMAQRLS
jgi:SAM-dependent methyltransferase